MISYLLIKNLERSFFLKSRSIAAFEKKFSDHLNESHPRVFQTIILSFFIAFKARQG